MDISFIQFILEKTQPIFPGDNMKGKFIGSIKKSESFSEVLFISTIDISL